MQSEGYGAFTQASTDIAEYIKHYNYKRGHSYNGYLSPAAAEAA